jgi:hypothetical protein
MDSPQVCCVCLYADRPQFAQQMLDSFRGQTYKNKGLLIYDTGDAPFDLFLLDLNGVTVRRGSQRTIGELRNAANSLVHHPWEIILHWDSDDWSAPTRIADQVNRLLETGKAVTGYHSMRFTDGEKWWKFNGPVQYGLGASLCYRRDWWERHQFQRVNVCEDRRFVDEAWNSGQYVGVDADDMMFATIHAGNTSPRQVSSSNWTPLPDCRELYPEAFTVGAAR